MESRTIESSKPASFDIKAKLKFRITKIKLADKKNIHEIEHSYANLTNLTPETDKEEICQKLAANSAIHVVSVMIKTNWECCTAHLAWELYLQLKKKLELVISLNKKFQCCQLWKTVQNTVISKDKLSKLLNSTAFADRGARITLRTNENSYEIEFCIEAGFYPKGVETKTDVNVGDLKCSLADTPSTLFEQMIDRVYEVRRQYKKQFLQDPTKVNEIFNEIFKPPHAVTSDQISRITNVIREVEMEVNFELTFPGRVPIELRDREIIVQKAVVIAVLHSESARNPAQKNDAELAWKLFLLMADKPYEPSMTHKCKPLFVPVSEHIEVNESMSRKRTYSATINLKIKSKSVAIKYIIGTCFHLYTTQGGVPVVERTTLTKEQPQMIKAYDACKTALAENEGIIVKDIVKVLEKQWPDTIDV